MLVLRSVKRQEERTRRTRGNLQSSRRVIRDLAFCLGDLRVRSWFYPARAERRGLSTSAIFLSSASGSSDVETKPSTYAITISARVNTPEKMMTGTAGRI